MTPEEEAFVARLRVEPSASSRRVAREAGISGRTARRLQAGLETEGVVRSRRRRWLLLGVLIVGGASWRVVSTQSPVNEARPPAPARRDVSAEIKAHERDLYLALDHGDPAPVQLAVANLTDESDAMRVASLRYLASVGVTEHLALLVPLFDDPSERVRAVAIQALGRQPGAETEGALVRVLCSPERPLSERLLALGCLRQRRAADPEALARALLPALLHDPAAVRDETARFLVQLTEKKPAPYPTEPVALHAAWRDALGVVE